VWAATGNARVAQLDARSGRVETRVAVGNGPAAIAAGADAAWVADSIDNTLTRIDAAGVTTGPLPVGRGPSGIALGAGGVWVANTLDDTVTGSTPPRARPGRSSALGQDRAASPSARAACGSPTRAARA
jgi:DNA-binding beta-propeller fold protein YncE